MEFMYRVGLLKSVFLTCALSFRTKYFRCDKASKTDIKVFLEYYETSAKFLNLKKPRVKIH